MWSLKKDKWDKVVLKEWTSGTEWYRKKGWLPSWTHCADLQFEFRLICFYWWCPVTLVFSSFSPRQQAKMANYCRSIFGEMLLDAPLDSHPVTQFMLSWMASTILIMWNWRDKENSLCVCVCVWGGGGVTGVCVCMCMLQVCVCDGCVDYRWLCVMQYEISKKVVWATQCVSPTTSC